MAAGSRAGKDQSGDRVGYVAVADRDVFTKHLNTVANAGGHYIVRRAKRDVFEEVRDRHVLDHDIVALPADAGEVVGMGHAAAIRGALHVDARAAAVNHDVALEIERDKHGVARPSRCDEPGPGLELKGDRCAAGAAALIRDPRRERAAQPNPAA